MSTRPSVHASAALAETAAMARELIDPSSLARVAEYVASQANPNGGFRGRSGESDLYYTMFGAECLVALGGALPAALPGYVADHGGGEGLDLVHLSCLARCLAILPDREGRVGGRVLARIEECRCAGRGYRLNAGDDWPSAYAGFLAWLAHAALGAELPEPNAVTANLEQLRAADGGFADRPGSPTGTTTVTAATIALCAGLGHPAPRGAVEWLQAQHHPLGGFLASPLAPVPDLLSTASAALALKSAGRPPAAIAPSVLGFVEDCWHSNGGFSGHAFDPDADCEYTFYGLLSLGAVVETR